MEGQDAVWRQTWVCSIVVLYENVLQIICYFSFVKKSLELPIHLLCIPNKSVLRKETDIIHLNGGGHKVFTLVEGVQKVLEACKGGSNIVDDKNFQLPTPTPTKVFVNTPIKSRNWSF